VSSAACPVLRVNIVRRELWILKLAQAVPPALSRGQAQSIAGERFFFYLLKNTAPETSFF